jgi:hypothetical protein
MGNCFLYKRGFGGGFGGGSGGEDIPEIEKTASGKVIAILDSTEKHLKGLRLFGKTTQNGTPSPDAPVPMESVGDGGSIGVNVAGKNLWGNGDFTFTKSTQVVLVNPLPPGVYTISALCTSSDIDDTRCRVNFQKATSVGDGNVYVYFNRGVRDSGIVTLEKEVTKVYLYSSTSNAFSDGDTATFSNIQIETGSIATEYEPYKEPQTLTLSTPNGLPGIHVSEGGNYTDENGWQWICDEVDFAGRKYVQRGAKSVITGDTVVSVQTSPSTEKSLLVYLGAPFDDDQTGIQNRRCMTDRFVNYLGHNPRDLTGPGDVENIGFNPSKNFCSNLYLRINRNRLVTQDVAGVKAFLNANPINVIYQLITPITTDLSSEELAQYTALRTLSPSTTLYNDAGSYMEVKYMAKGG